MHRYELFNPSDGKPIHRVPFAWVAWIVAKLDKRHGFLDYAKVGGGWIN